MTFPELTSSDMKFPALDQHTKKMTLKGIWHVVISYLFAPYAFVGIFISILTAALVVGPFFKKHLFAYLHWWQKLLMEMLFLTCGFELELEGLEHINDDESYIIACNHRSWVDVFATVFAFKPKLSFVFMVNDYLLKIPFAGRFMLMAGYVPVSKGRKKKKQKGENKIQQAAEGIQKGVSILVFPEGTRMPDHRFGVFKRGVFSIAQSTQTKVVPVVVSGTGTLFPRGTPFARPGKVRVEILPPLPAPTDNDDAAKWLGDLRTQIASRYRLEADSAPLAENPELLDAALGVD
ncbi:MAG: 1-acyl-sn-glycerol-3-phosphate acyltransferase [Deltaproteobacteria bacterium]|nr:1-acyl-sn-glycerol-3-phosphate acyltransferase [Deltaproteobacteria bacterium]